MLDPVLDMDWNLGVLLAVDVPCGLCIGKGGFASQQFGSVEVDMECPVVSHGADVVRFIPTGHCRTASSSSGGMRK